jgi:hypothetical protein
MMAKVGENAPVYGLLLSIKNYQVLKPLCFSVWFWERENWKFLLPDQSYM